MLLVAVGWLGCRSSDPREAALQERGRWNVQVLGWTESDNGMVRLDVRLSGPPNSQIDEYTVRVDLVDGTQQPLAQHWYTFDLTKIVRGGPKDMMVSVPSAAQPAQAVIVHKLPNPTAEEAQNMPEVP